MKEFGMGCIKPLYDPRDYQFSDVVAGINKTTKVNLSKVMMPERFYPPRNFIFDQGDSQMCCACAISQVRYIQEFNQRNERVIFSPIYLYGNRVPSTVGDGEIYTGEGMYLKDALKKTTTGISPIYFCHEGSRNNDKLSTKYMGPYNGITYGDAKNIYENYVRYTPSHEDMYCKPYRISSYYAVNNEKEIMEAIITTGGVVATFLVTSGWYETGKNGIIQNTGMIQGAHAVAIVGWKKINDQLYWIIINSWGEEWGDKGYGYININEQKWILEAYCMIDDVLENIINPKEDDE